MYAPGFASQAKLARMSYEQNATRTEPGGNPSQMHGCPLAPDKFLQIQKKAGANSAEAQTQLASCYELVRNVAPNRAERGAW